MFLVTNPVRLAALTFLASLLWTSVASASHFRFAHLTWRKRADLAPNTVEFTLYVSYRRSSTSGTAPDGRAQVGDIFGETGLSFGDASSISGQYLVLAADTQADWVFGRAVVSAQDTTSPILHTYGGPGPFTASISSCCRISTLRNSADANFRIATIVDLNLETNSPVSNLPPIVNVAPGGMQTFNLAAADADSDRLAFRLAGTGTESGLSSHPPNLSVDANSGVVTWDTTSLTLGLYTTQIIIEARDRNTSALKTSVAIDFILNLTSAQLGNPPLFERPPTPANETTIAVQPAEPITFTLRASDTDVGASVTLNAIGIPQGAAMLPVLPAIGNPVSSAFNWTPTSNDLGPHVIVFIATDNTGQQALFTVTITVAQTVFRVTYTPGFSMITMPCDIPNPVSVFGAGVLIAGWDASTQSYQIGNNFPLTRGVGYWVRLANSAAVTLPNCNDNSLLRWNLRRGWNLIGNGYAVDLPWRLANIRVVVNNQSTPLSSPTQAVANFAWIYEGASYRLVVDPSVVASVPAALGTPFTAIPSGRGVWVYANVEGAALEFDAQTLNQSRTLRSAASTTATISRRPRQAWMATLRATVGGASGDALSFGYDANQPTTVVRHQKPPPAPRPANEPFVELALVDDNGQRLSTESRRSLRPGEGWNLVVTTNASGEEVHLNWPTLGTVPAPYRLTLVDLESGVRRSLRTTSGYALRASSTHPTTRRLRIEVGSPSAALRVANVSLQPAGTALQVSYTISTDARVSGRLLNPAGKTITARAATSVRAGLNSLVLMRADALGRTAARGVYLFELTAEDDEGNQVKAIRSIALH